jgi:phosphoglucomutase/phosphomannomutase
MPHSDALAQLEEQAASQGRLSPGAVQNLRIWLSEPRYEEYVPQIVEHFQQGKWRELDDVFWTVIPFGTGGRRGKMYPIGSNAINDRTIGESAQGLADYVREQIPGGPWSCAIGYDTRHRSRHFAELCAEVMAAAGFTVWFLDGYRSTPELSFTVRHKRCSCGIMVTASHNPPSDNAVKCYWSTGGQLLPPHDRHVIDRVMSVGTIHRIPFAQALSTNVAEFVRIPPDRNSHEFRYPPGRVIYCQDEVDAAYLANVRVQGFGGPRELKIIYSPLHGVGAAGVCPVLAEAGFRDVEVFGPHAEPNGDFPNVPGHVSNPENPAVFDSIIEHAGRVGADVILATDPDADRLGCAAPVEPGGAWRTFTGNQIAALLAEYVLESRKAARTLSPEHYVATTLVTTGMVRRIADAYNVRTYDNLLVGFKWIAHVIDQVGPEKFVYGCEESHGYQVGTYARDKDGPAAALLMAELAARVKASGQTLHQKLDALFWQYGCHAERTISRTMPGAEGMSRMLALMARFRESPPASLAGLPLRQVRDYENLVTISPTGTRQPLKGPQGDLVIFDLAAEGNYVAVRPSGTEPKVKFYLFAYEAAEMLANLDDTKSELEARLDAFERELNALAGA